MSLPDLTRGLWSRFVQMERGAVGAFPRNESDEGAAEGGSSFLAASIVTPMTLAADEPQAAAQLPASPRRMAFVLALGALISKALGFAREILMAHALGASIVADGFRGAVGGTNIPLIYLQNESVPAILIPMYRDARRRGEARAHLVSISCAVTLAAVAIMLLVEVFGGYWVALLFGGFDERGRAVTLDFVRVMALSMPASALLNALAAGEIADGLTRIANWRPNLLNLAMMLGLLVYVATSWTGALGWAFTLGFNALAAWSLWTHHREGRFDYAGLGFDKISAAAREFLLRLRPIIALPFAEQAHMWIERIAASRVMIGAVASVDYARTLSETALLIISQPVGLAFMSSYKEGESHRQIEAVARLILALTGAASAYAFVFAPDIVRLVFLRGAFSETGLLLTSSALRGASAGLWASTLGWILLRQLNSDGRNALATTIVVGAYLSNISVNVVTSWLAPSTQYGLLFVGLGETARSLALFVGAVLALPDRGRLFALAPIAAAPAVVMLLAGVAIQQLAESWLARLAIGGGACVLCTAFAILLLVPQARSRCVAGLRKLARRPNRA